MVRFQWPVLQKITRIQTYATYSALHYKLCDLFAKQTVFTCQYKQNETNAMTFMTSQLSSYGLQLPDNTINHNFTNDISFQNHEGDLSVFLSRFQKCPQFLSTTPVLKLCPF